MLEKLVHANAILPPNQHFIRITIPNGTSFERFPGAAHPGWDARTEDVCKHYGEAWHEQRRSAILLVSSIPARVATNILINLRHPEAGAITSDLPEPVWWDDRLYR